MAACVDDDRVRFARAHCARKRLSARWWPAKSLPRFFRLSVMRYALCAMLYALMRYALCVMRYALCAMRYALCAMCRQPRWSMSKVTSTCGTPRGAGGIPSKWNFPNMLLSFVIARSPSKTWISTPGWLSA